MIQNINKIVEKHLGEHVERLPSYLKGTIHILVILYEITLLKETSLVSIDVEALSSSIQRIKGQHVIDTFLKEMGSQWEEYNYMLLISLDLILTQLVHI